MRLEEKGWIDHSIFVYSFSKGAALKDKVRFIRDFFGYRISKNGRNYQYKGIIHKLGGLKISNNSFVVPNNKSEIVEAYLRSYGVDFVVKR